MNPELLDQAWQTARLAFPEVRPAGGMLLGTGWSAAFESLLARGAPFALRRALAYRDIPGLGNPTVPGHGGRLLWVTAGGRDLFVFQGRRHWYEGAGWEPVAIPVFLLRQFGADRVLLTNAAGSLRPAWKSGSLMAITDHISTLGSNPLIGPHDPAWGARFPDLSQVYDEDLRARLQAAAARAGIPLTAGVYLGVAGPAYETPAEIRAFRAWGADAVGSSTVPEAILAHAAGLRVAGVSCLTNYAAGIAAAPLDHADVQAAAAGAEQAMGRLLAEFWQERA